ncbi:hypothetical protein SAMN05421805_112118 [Saccharopolyspora antimicrobica]|uniref:Uncharacterized protein n=1 Tax=Saccharopolyspora antimicrobica TaxID=455193 RepID=A0A1I5G629_9PSEU|nr:hypothetical protein [Saccharopolyspora antimicrobica]RKT83907.1 hypothetical protein ATL45_2202 [Saccharopolyspora antimicrobica]SFO31478.1 hypothetical protein SAMN05421805_112118 [Saccharopolyspora antimicrobica]
MNEGQHAAVAPPSPAPEPAPSKQVPVISAAKPPVITGERAAAPKPDDTAFAPALGSAEWHQQASGAVLTSAAAVSAPVAQAAAAPLPPGGPGPHEDDTPTEVVRKPRGWRPRKQRSVPRLDIGRHLATEADLELLQLTGTSFGFPLGRNQAGFPVTLTLFQPVPVSIALVGASWAARLLAYRALRFGAKVHVFTDRPAGWADLGRAATDREDRVAVLEPGALTSVAATADAPILSLYDAESPPPPAKPAPWQARAMVLHRFTPHRSEAALSADVLLLQRLAPDEAAAIAAARRLTAQTAEQLRAMHDDMLAVLTKSENHYVWVTPEEREQDELGAPGRY